MKLTKLSLLTVLALNTSAFAADTLAAAFKSGKINGSLKAMYWDREISAGEASILTTGLRLGYETASFNGFVFKAEAQTSASPFANEEAKTVFGKTAFGGDMYGSGSVLSEANISYSFNNTNFKVGRMYLDTPVVASSGNRMIKQSFEAAMITNKSFKNTTLTAGYIQRYQNRSDGAGNIAKFEKFNDNGAYTLAINTKPSENLDLTFAYLDNIDKYQVGLAKATLKMGIFDFGTQYYHSKVENEKDAKLLTLRAGVKIGKAYFDGACSKVFDDKEVKFGLGSGADQAYAGSLVFSPNYNPNTKTYQIGAAYDLTDNMFIKTMYTETNDDINKYSYVSLLSSYAFTGSLKGLNATMIFEDEGKDGDAKEFRFNLAYNF